MPTRHYVDRDGGSVVLDPNNPDPRWRAPRTSDEAPEAQVSPRPPRRPLPTDGPITARPIRRAGEGDLEGTIDEEGDIPEFLVESGPQRRSPEDFVPMPREAENSRMADLARESRVEQEMAQHLTPDEAAAELQAHERRKFEEKISKMRPAERAAFLRFGGMARIYRNERQE